MCTDFEIPDSHRLTKPLILEPFFPQRPVKKVLSQDSLSLHFKKYINLQINVDSVQPYATEAFVMKIFFLAFTENFICCYIDSCFLILTLLQASSSKYMWQYIPKWFYSLAHIVGKFISWFLKLLKRFLRILHLNNHASFT